MTVDVAKPQIVPMLTPPEAAQLLGVDVSTVRRLARKKQLPGAVYIGRQLRFRVTEFKAFVEGRDNVFSAGFSPTRKVG